MPANPKLQLGEIEVDLVIKDIKNIHLSVHPPTGRVRISAPSHMNHDTVRAYAISRLDWIRKQQNKLREQERETPRDLIDRESHYVWGKRYLLKVAEHEAPPSVELTHRALILRVRPGANAAKRAETLARWYRDQIRAAVKPLLARWEPILGVKVRRGYVQRMKTRWGGCSPARAAIRLNTELAKKPPECLEYIVVHEMAHLLEATHNERFVALMDSFMPSTKCSPRRGPPGEADQTSRRRRAG